MDKKRCALNVGYIPKMDGTVIFSEKENSTEFFGWYYDMPNQNTEFFSKEKLLSAFYSI